LEETLKEDTARPSAAAGRRMLEVFHVEHSVLAELSLQYYTYRTHLLCNEMFRRGMKCFPTGGG